MSETEGSSGGSSTAGGSDTEIMFQCKRCPGSRFTAAERDVHRQWHLDKMKKARASRRGSRIPVSTPSEATTMFTRAEDVGQQEEASSPTRKKSTASSKKPIKQRPNQKITPEKHYNPPKNRKKKLPGA